MLLCQAFLVVSQTPYYYKINEENGLPSSEVYQIIQDDFGYIWIGCDAGMYRYDGVRFRAFTSKKQNSKSISGIKIDKDKTIWCQNFSGQIFKINGDSLSLVIDISNKIVSYSQYTIDNEKHIWIANDKSIEVFDLNGKSLSSIVKLNTQKDSIRWQEIEKNSSGDVYVCSQSNGIGVIRKKGTQYDVFFLDTIVTPNKKTALEPYDQGLIALEEDNLKREYVVSEIRGNAVIKKNKLFPFTKDGLIYKVCKDNLGRHWLCTSSGIVKVNKDYKLDEESVFILNNDKISGIYQDREGNLWVSSLQNGIYVIPDYDLKIYDQQSSTLTDHNITALLKTTQNELLVGTYTGSVMKLDQNNRFNLLPQQSSVSYRTVKKIKEKDGGLYIAHGPLSFIEKNKETVFNAYNFRDFCWIGDDLFFVTSSMFGVLPSFHQIPNIELGKRASVIHHRGCRALVLDEKTKIIYFASIDGLFKYFEGKIEEIKLFDKSVHANKLIFKDEQLWIGTVNEGVYVLKNGKIIKKYDSNNLLHGNSVKSFKIVSDHVFIATETGLTKINYKTDETEFYDYSDGVVSKEINDIEFWNESIFLATNKGLLKLPGRNSINQIRPNIEVTGFYVNHNPIQLNEKNSNLNHDENTITIEFNTACLKARGDFKYKYRLIGLDTNWVYNTAVNNQTQYLALPSGDFKFEVKAVNEDGVESLKTEVIMFHIETPFWQRWWFYIFLIVAVSGIVALLFMVRIGFIKRRAELKNKVTASQLTALKSQMNPHFLFNTLNSLQDLILKHDIKNSNFYLNKFSMLMREILDVSGKEEISLSREIEILDTYLELEKLRFGDDFKFEIKIDETLDTDHLVLPPMIIQPFIENALKHGLLHKKGDKDLRVEFKLIQDVLVCEVIDNGVGRKKSEEIKARNTRTYQSFATQATDKRMDLLNSFNNKKYNFEIIDLYDEDKPSGTKVIITIPI